MRAAAAVLDCNFAMSRRNMAMNLKSEVQKGHEEQNQYVSNVLCIHHDVVVPECNLAMSRRNMGASVLALSAHSGSWQQSNLPSCAQAPCFSPMPCSTTLSVEPNMWPTSATVPSWHMGLTTCAGAPAAEPPSGKYGWDDSDD